MTVHSTSPSPAASTTFPETLELAFDPDAPLDVGFTEIEAARRIRSAVSESPFAYTKARGREGSAAARAVLYFPIVGASAFPSRTRGGDNAGANDFAPAFAEIAKAAAGRVACGSRCRPHRPAEASFRLHSRSPSRRSKVISTRLRTMARIESSSRSLTWSLRRIALRVRLINSSRASARRRPAEVRWIP